ncbi:group 1 truncated hemoglobin [Tamilnaduibacter salinus]|uniref:Group 1 truncated hemoglobin n=1 Tax=Tamilnaduibacter salinus TaxID=1484056 RepID=A0A2A2I5H7_9GAMM|nr:group 1 truncated hemoglobin [Tamilnaduibacter salinus]PAV26907.1 group 1 truncated hemoglobin [Tamilnaduibacter salinus]
MKIILAVLTSLLLLGGCQSPAPSAAAGEDTLYNALGERSGIADIVEDMLYRIVEDPRLADDFRGIDVARFHRQLTDQLCHLSGGPCTYTGRSMEEAHAGMNVTEAQFNAVADHLVLAMETHSVPTGAQNRLLARLVPLHDRIVGH